VEVKVGFFLCFCREIPSNTFFFVKKVDGRTCPVRVSISEALRFSSTFVVVRVKEFSPLCAAVVLSLDGLVLEASNVEIIGYRTKELIGKNVSASCAHFLQMPDKHAVKMVLFPESSEPILSALTVRRSDMTVGLEFEIIDNSLELLILLGNDGIILECSSYSAHGLTGHTREQLMNQSINLLVPSLFPVIPTDVRFCCQALHREGHHFCVLLVLYRTATGQICCQMRQISTQSANEDHCTNLQDLEIPDVKLGALLGKGAFCAVRLGIVKSVSIARISAIKFVDKKAAACALKEAEILRTLDHCSIPKLHFIVSTKTYVVVAMEFCPGVELGHYLTLHGSVLITECEARHYFCNLASVVAYIHGAGIIHRDIKVENMMVVADGSSMDWRRNHIKLIDYGMSCQFQQGVLQNTFCGTAAYASPQILSNQPYDGPGGDIWAMGVVLFRTLVGKLPFSCAQEVLLKGVQTTTIASTSCAYLITQLLTKDAMNRITISQIVSHSWLQNENNAVRVENNNAVRVEVVNDGKDERSCEFMNGGTLKKRPFSELLDASSCPAEETKLSKQ
jgi:hypothetical protein